MENKYWKLLLNLHTRHIIRKIPENNQLNEQLQQLHNLDFKNFFILASSSRIAKVLNEINCRYYKNNFLWIPLTTDFDVTKLLLGLPRCEPMEHICQNNSKTKFNVSFLLLHL